MDALMLTCVIESEFQQNTDTKSIYLASSHSDPSNEMINRQQTE